VSELWQRIHEAIESRQLLRRGQQVLVAVSGGMDSMVLLHILYQLSSRNRWRLSVAHLNHRLRGRSSDADERLVRGVSKRLGLPIFVERAEVRRLAKEQKLSIEMAARRARHEFLARIAAKKRIPTIALAHHADDQVELFFIRLLRGAGGEGLAGMKWRSPSPAAKGIQIVRPLLDEPKSALQQYAAENKIKFREDATNTAADFLRNRIRLELLPLLRRDYQPGLSRNILRLMEILRAEAELAGQIAENWLKHTRGSKGEKPLPPFSALPPAVQRRCLQLQLLTEGISPDFDLIEKLRLEPGEAINIESSASIPKSVSRDPDGLVHVQTAAPIQFNTESRKLSLARAAGGTTFNGVSIAWRLKGRRGMVLPPRRLGTEYFDAERVGGRIVLRHWQTGDRFQPIGMPTAVKLQDLFVNQKVPRELRHRLVVAESAKGDIFWVEGMRISERFQLTKATKRRLQWRWRRD
jgi:tRNA(Ile)-lysidine synthase